ncbi:hypothetical protein BofuT4_uP100510.1 [Botrytis cinerea T4]|uniref:Uncharacterized protein n=1 Tax=Botryotinia fuckeliana (strain T4) TaxID=999810 RepID=G2YBQ6_BOTF4|nr:hypothetical protein BofuT4_uP100510.1 [Botrytis cinerea T4]
MSLRKMTTLASTSFLLPLRTKAAIFDALLEDTVWHLCKS